MRLVLLGAPGSGKGTQGVALAQHFDVGHLSSGELLRREVAAATPLGRRVARYVTRGELVPDDLVLTIVRDALRSAAHVDGYILDGFPRTRSQAQGSGIAVDAVVYLEMNDDVARSRVSSRAAEGRVDDASPAALERRLQSYHRETLPLLDHFREQGTLHTIDADQVVADVTDAILMALGAGVA